MNSVTWNTIASGYIQMCDYRPGVWLSRDMVTDGSKVNFELLTGRMVEAWERDTHGLAVRTHWYDASQVQRRYGACSHVVQIKMLRCPGLVTWNNDI